MRICVTGVRGCVGSVVATVAAERGHDVVGFDDNSRGLNDPGPAGVHVVGHDCRDGIRSVCENTLGFRPEAVLHLAAGTDPLDRTVEELHRLNLAMTQRVFNDASALGCRAFVFPTTSLAAGVPDSPYVISKEEAMAWLLGRAHRSLIPLRFCSIVGAYRGMTEHRRKEVHVVPALLEAYSRGRSFTINGADYETVDGTPARDYVNLLDVAEFILALVDRKMGGESITPWEDGVVWCGTGKATTTLELINIFRRRIGPVAVTIGDRRPLDTGMIKCPDAQALNMREVLQRPLVSVEESLVQEVETLLDVTRATAAGRRIESSRARQ